MPKISKEAVVYMPPALNHREFTCGGCILFLVKRTESNRKFGHCEILYPSEVDDDDGCTLYIPGKPKIGGTPRRLLPARTAGLDEGPFTCKRCRHYGGDRDPGSSGPCELVEGVVQADGCCNAWEKSA
jgi:hypothetical protein